MFSRKAVLDVGVGLLDYVVDVGLQVDQPQP